LSHLVRTENSAINTNVSFKLIFFFEYLQSDTKYMNKPVHRIL